MAQTAPQQWMVYTKKADFRHIADRFGIDPVLARILTNRGIVGDEAIDRYLNGTLKDLYDPALLKGADRASEILLQKIRDKKRIRVVGDYDIDGVCSTYILVSALSALGADVDHRIPHRIKDGYGINEAIIDEALADGIDTIITCDNGISAFSQVEKAKTSGMTVIVTDHHEIPKDGDREVIPPADVVIDPKMSESGYPFPEICGAVVAWKLIAVLLRNAGRPDSDWMKYLDFAAIATVGDVMPLIDENRIIVKYGLPAVERTENPGLCALIEKTGAGQHALTAYTIGFVIGPAINAGGRLESADLAEELFLSKNPFAIEELSKRLVELNDERKDMTEEETVRASEIVESQYEDDKVLVVYLPGCHESLAGIIAGRLREKYQKPSIVLTDGETSVKGSGRSIENYHMFAKLTEVKDLLLKFGGHPMAAGLSIDRENVDEFRRRLNENSGLTDADLTAKIWIDVPMPIGYVSKKLIGELELLEPFGQANDKPIFAEAGLGIRSCRVLGKNRNVVKMTLVEPDGHAMEAVVFTDGDCFEEERGGRTTVDIVYYPEINEYNGRKSLQAVVRRYRFR